MERHSEIPKTYSSESEGNFETTEKLRVFIADIAKESKDRDGIPLENDGRIDMQAFKKIYPDVDVDKRKVQERLEKWHGKDLRKRLEGDGEKLEMLAYAIFYKILKDEFIVVRSSLHDDAVNKVDTLLLERATGNLVCAFDEVGATAGPDFEEKQKLIRDHNLHDRGVSLKYGLRLEKGDGEERQISLGEVSNVPLFYIALPKDLLDKGIVEFKFDNNEQSEFEEKLFEYFMASIALQIQSLELYSGRLDKNLKKRLTAFSNIVANLKN